MLPLAEQVDDTGIEGRSPVVVEADDEEGMVMKLEEG